MFHQGIIYPVEGFGIVTCCGFIPETHHAQGYRRQDFERRMFSKLFFEPAGQADMIAYVVLQLADPERADHKPQFQRPEAPAQLYAPVAVIVNQSAAGGFQVLGQYFEGSDQGFFVNRLSNRNW